jgi:hypothetical protein
MIDYTSIETQIQRIKGKVEETYDIAEAKGAEIPATKNIDNLPATVASIPSGGGGDGITTNQIIRAMDLSKALVDKNVVFTESDYTEENIEIMTDLMAVTVGGIQ